METVVSILISTLISAFVLWLSIKIVDRYNSSNTFGLALILGLGFSIFGSFCIGPLVILPLVALLFLLIRFYDLGLGKSLLVVLLIGALKVGIGLVLATAMTGLGLT